jgi:hypothetical protein
MLRLLKCVSNVPFARSDPPRSVIHVHTPFVNILEVDLMCYIGILQLLEAISVTQNHSE